MGDPLAQSRRWIDGFLLGRADSAAGTGLTLINVEGGTVNINVYAAAAAPAGAGRGDQDQERASEPNPSSVCV